MKTGMRGFLLLYLFELLFELLLHISFLDSQVGPLLFLLSDLSHVLAFQDVFHVIALLKPLDSCNLFLALGSVYFMGLFFISTGWSLLFLLFVPFLWLFIFFQVLIFLRFLLISLSGLLSSHGLCFVDNIEVRTDEIVDR